jgi:type VI secretion system protein ImpG
MRGQRIELTLRQDHFAGVGDLLLFGAVLDSFFGGYSSLNTFIQLAVKEGITGEIYLWPARLGERPLI